MYRQSPSRNQRSKAIRVKNVLQICLLIAVCFWLIYQVKHSHEKKKEFDESDAKPLLHRTSSDEFIKLGRKDIQPRVVETITKHENHDEALDEDENSGEEIEENKHEEDEPEEKKVEGTEDDETDEHEQENSDAEVDREQDLENGEDKEDGDENETQETDSEDGHDQIEKEITVDDTDHDADDRSTHEAREEHYKADDASSAVTHDTLLATTENENERVENSNRRPENVIENENKESNSRETYESENRKNLEVEGGKVASEGHQSNATTSETKVGNSENGFSSNNTTTEGLSDHLTSNNTTEVTIKHHDLPTENVTKSEPELGEVSDLRTIDLERPDNSTINMGTTRFDSNSTGSAEIKDAESLSELSGSSNNSTDSSTSETLPRSEASMQAGNNTESSSKKNDEVEDEKSEISDGTDENLETTLTENTEEFQQDAIDMSDTSNSMEEKDVRTDLDTLPDIQTGGTNIEDAAAE